MPQLKIMSLLSKKTDSKSPKMSRKGKKKAEDDKESIGKTEDEGSSLSSGNEADREDTPPTPLLATVRVMETNNSGSFDDDKETFRRTPPPSPVPKGSISPKPFFLDDSVGDGYDAPASIGGQMEENKAYKQEKGAFVKMQTPKSAPNDHEMEGKGMALIRSNSSRLESLVQTEGRLLILNDDLTLRSLKPDEDASTLTHTMGAGGIHFGHRANLEEVLKNFKRLPVDTLHHFASVGEYLKILHLENKMIDVLIHISNQTFAAHRVALACHSKYFNDRFMMHDDNTKLPDHITLHGMSPFAFQSFLRFVYAGELTLSPERLGDTMAIAKKLGAPGMKTVCSEYVDTIPIDKALAVISNQKIERNTYIFKYTYALAVENFCDLFDSDDFMKLPVDLVCQLLDDDYLYVNSEMDVFWAALKWIAYHITERHNFLIRVMRCVRFQLLSQRELFQCFEVTDLLRKSAPCRDMILSANWMHTTNEVGRPDPLQLPKIRLRMCMRDSYVPQSHESFKAITDSDEETEPKKHNTSQNQAPVTWQPEQTITVTPAISASANSDMTDHILAVGGFQKMEKNKEVPPKDIEVYNTSKNQWRYYTGLPEARQHHAVAMLDGKLYLVGGSDANKGKRAPVATSTGFVFDPATDQWKSLPPLSTPRMNHALMPLAGKLYAIGGQDDKNRIVGTVECYDPVTDSWIPVKDLHFPRCGFGATVCEGRIYVLGGFGNPQNKRSAAPVLNNFECYDPISNTWQSLCPLEEGRCLCNLVCVGTSIYVCGGAARRAPKQPLTSLGTIDEYDAESNEWCHKTDLITPRHSAGGTVIGTKIYLTGGVSSIDNKILKSTECFDTRTECWDTTVEDLPYPAKWLGCVAVPLSQ